MNLLLGIRIALAGGRESLARMALMALGIAIGVVLLLVTLTGLPILQGHIDRLAWHRTDAASPATAPDPALWLAVTDRYAGRDVIRVHVAALGPRPPVPPGVERLPGPGEVVVSPGLAELMRTVPDDQLRNRFPGRIVGTIGPEGLIAPAELVGIVGRTPQEMRNTYGAYEIRGIEQPGERLDLAAFWGILFALLAVLIVGPVVAFVSMATRIGGARREVRFAAVRLAGATRLQTAVLAATETGGAALAGIVLGCLGFLAIRPIVASVVTLGHGMPIFTQDVRAPIDQAVVTLAAVLVLVIGTTLVALGPVQITPLGVRQRGRRTRPRAWRLLPIAVGILGTWYASELQRHPELEPIPIAGYVSLLSQLSILVGFFLAGAWVCHWISRGLARLSGSATTLIVARRIAADPYSTFRSVSGAALAMYVATGLGLAAAAERGGTPAATEHSSVLKDGVVAVHVQGAPEASFAALMSDGVVVARAAQDTIVVSCADLSRVANVTCPFAERTDYDNPAYTRLEDLFTLPHPGATSADSVFGPRGFLEPGPYSSAPPIQTLFIPTDGTRAAQERVRTLAAAVPISRSKTSDDLPGQTSPSVTGAETVLPYAMAFVLLVAACSLTVSVINGVLERRRPFALLRASGVRLGELRRIVMLETGVPLLLTVLFGVGLAMLTTYAAAPPSTWMWPSAGFLSGLGIGAVAAFAVSLIALPFMDVATRYDSVRFE
jgi:FtsX-like permease family